MRRADQLLKLVGVARVGNVRLMATETEKGIAEKLKQSLTAVKNVSVRDTSGGCGSMYEIDIVADDFKGMSVVKQHQLVHKVLKEEIKQWHGLTLNTKAE